MRIMGTAVEHQSDTPAGNPGRRMPAGFDAPREFLGNRLVYLVVSPRARGLSVGVNLNPDRRCNFDCLYCDVDRNGGGLDALVDVELMAGELTRTLEQVCQGQVRQLESFRNLPEDLLELRQVAISGDGEPTLCPVFADALRAVVHVRARGQFPFFKIVLLTNGTALDHVGVQNGLRMLVPRDEIWAKLDGGSSAYFRRINRPHVSLERVLSNILLVGKQRPIVIQSLFPMLDGQEPPDEEIDAYALRLRGLKEGGAQIALVQICSATRHTTRSHCGHLPLRVLSRIAQWVRGVTGLRVEVF
jgi:wyosine [tRNA(Phe)-imidazoG37] synthetase (radical SAM superfamily)